MDEFMLPIFKEDDIYTELMKTHLNDRRIVLNGEIGGALVEEATLYIMQWNKEDRDRKIAPENRKPIYIYLNSLGGDITYGLAFSRSIIPFAIFEANGEEINSLVEPKAVQNPQMPIGTDGTAKIVIITHCGKSRSKPPIKIHKTIPPTAAPINIKPNAVSTYPNIILNR